jgi:Cysteine-rich secretory protein family
MYFKLTQFTQCAWPDTKRVGCASKSYSAGGQNKVVIVCEYDPPGNVAGVVLKYGINQNAVRILA